MPPLPDWGSHLLETLFEIGPVGNDAPIPINAIGEWAALLGIEWEPWEARLLYRLSREYYGEMHQATKWDADPPWEGCKPDFYLMASRRAERALKHERAREQMLKGTHVNS